MDNRQYQALFLMLIAAFLLTLPYLMRKPDAAHHRILVATEKLKDGIFDETVIFMGAHMTTGARGYVVNKPAVAGQPGFGGPVKKDDFVLLHSDDVTVKESHVIPDLRLAVTEGDAAAEMMAAEKKPRAYIFLKGHAGWGMGQLNRELARGTWKIIDCDPALIFDTPPEKMWKEAVGRPPSLPSAKTGVVAPAQTENPS